MVAVENSLRCRLVEPGRRVWGAGTAAYKCAQLVKRGVESDAARDCTM